MSKYLVIRPNKNLSKEGILNYFQDRKLAKEAFCRYLDIYYRS